MERSHALGGLVLGLTALIIAVALAVAVTAEDSSPAQPASVEGPATGPSETAGTRVERSRGERAGASRKASARRKRTQEDRQDLSRGGAVQTAQASGPSVVAVAGAVPDDDDRWESDDGDDDRHSGSNDSGGDESHGDDSGGDDD